MKYGRLEEPQETGKYVLVIANCNDEGRDVLASGTYSWVSKHGYLPGEMFGEMYFLLFLTCVYLGIFLWYGFSMKYYEDEIIPIQRWILMTILLGLVETFFRTGDLFVWNEDGTRFWFAMYSGVLVGVLKRAISRCMLVMVSLGWGVNRDSLGSTMKKIVGLGILYAGVAVARDILTIIAVEDLQKVSDAQGGGIGGLGRYSYSDYSCTRCDFHSVDLGLVECNNGRFGGRWSTPQAQDFPSIAMHSLDCHSLCLHLDCSWTSGYLYGRDNH